MILPETPISRLRGNLSSPRRQGAGGQPLISSKTKAPAPELVRSNVTMTPSSADDFGVCPKGTEDAVQMIESGQSGFWLLRRYLEAGEESSDAGD